MADKASVLSELARAMAVEADARKPLPLRLCQACVRILGVDGGAITVAYTRTDRVTLCATDPVAGRLEDLQDVLGQGPGSAAYTTGRAVVITLAEAAQAWPVFGGAAQQALGQLTVYALPICPDDQVLGVLTLYQSRSRALRHDLDAGLFLADALGAALLRDPTSQHDPSPGPWSSRARVHQATGQVIAQLGIGPDDALALLRAHAFAHDATLDEIATEILDSRLDFSQPDDSQPDDSQPDDSQRGDPA